MPRRLVALLALALAGAAGEDAGASAPRGGSLLALDNAARGRGLAVALRPGERFSVTSQHSMYDAPVTEQFVVRDDGWIVLERVSSPSAAVREYFGLTAAGEHHALERALPEVVFRIAIGTPQRLRVAGRERSFLEVGEPGDRVVLRATPTRGRLAPRAAATGTARPGRTGP